MNCFNYIKTQYTLIIFGDTGKPTIIEKVLSRVIVDTLGKVADDICITVILDDDGMGYSELKKVISDKLRSISKDKSKFTSNQFPTLEEHNDSFILIPLKGRGNVEIRLSTVPESLEKQVAKKCIEVKYPKNLKILERGPHYALDFLAMEYYDGNKEKLIRETSALLKDEVWVTDVVERATS
ncbi:MAG: hypothetical protein GIS02_04910 [Methanosarcinales archaeon]|uniref:Uncharacterized protein n=1 Tax=Candidatus Ethanoperedens thermophilum TaxID=2766897 RepID=A0A848D8Y9_9EURY|nr:hypothetical protein [Candidatus Ethanoperedens thermophilum]